MPIPNTRTNPAGFLAEVLVALDAALITIVLRRADMEIDNAIKFHPFHRLIGQPWCLNHLAGFVFNSIILKIITDGHGFELQQHRRDLGGHGIGLARRHMQEDRPLRGRVTARRMAIRIEAASLVGTDSLGWDR